MVIYNNTGQFHALIQYPDALTATTAKAVSIYFTMFLLTSFVECLNIVEWLFIWLPQALDGQNIYNGCCTLRIDFSKLGNLTVKYNNEKTRYKLS